MEAMKLRTVALALALAIGFTGAMEAKQKPHKVKVQKPKAPKYKPRKVKRQKVA
jgi:precorrin isomerase